MDGKPAAKEPFARLDLGVLAPVRASTIASVAASR